MPKLLFNVYAPPFFVEGVLNTYGSLEVLHPMTSESKSPPTKTSAYESSLLQPHYARLIQPITNLS